MAEHTDPEAESGQEEAPIPFEARTAYHEAGHVVVAHLTSYRRLVFVSTRKWGRRGGFCIHLSRLSIFRMARQDFSALVDAEATFVVGGIAAEALLARDSDVSEGNWARGSDLWRFYGDCRRLRLDEEEQKTLFGRALSRAGDLLDDHWHLVEALAEELLVRRRLWAWQVHRILRRAEREHGA